MPAHVKSVDELKKEFAAAGGKAVIVDFYATWCGPCKMIAPKIEQWATQYPNVVVLKVDVDEAEDVSTQYGIQAMPTFKVFKNGQEVDEVVGASPDSVEALFKKYN